MVSRMIWESGGWKQTLKKSHLFSWYSFLCQDTSHLGLGVLNSWFCNCGSSLSCSKAITICQHQFIFMKRNELNNTSNVNWNCIINNAFAFLNRSSFINSSNCIILCKRDNWCDHQCTLYEMEVSFFPCGSQVYK